MVTASPRRILLRMVLVGVAGKKGNLRFVNGDCLMRFGPEQGLTFQAGESNPVLQLGNTTRTLEGFLLD
jgi:hypothetical protein